MKSGIYSIINLTNNKRYVGSSINTHKRLVQHFWLLRNNIHDNIFLQNSYNKYGKDSFIYEVLEECCEELLPERENYYIEHFKTLNSDFGYNLSLTNIHRTNILTDSVKIGISKTNLSKNNNFSKFSVTNLETGISFIFDSLVEAAYYFIDNGFSKGSPRNIRQKLSSTLRGKKINNGKNYNGSIRKTCYNHKLQIIN
jgi:group I intron endonuclease